VQKGQFYVGKNYVYPTEGLKAVLFGHLDLVLIVFAIWCRQSASLAQAADLRSQFSEHAA
jgi:hypothetical protein